MQMIIGKQYMKIEICDISSHYCMHMICGKYYMNMEFVIYQVTIVCELFAANITWIWNLWLIKLPCYCWYILHENGNLCYIKSLLYAYDLWQILRENGKFVINQVTIVCKWFVANITRKWKFVIGQVASIAWIWNL